MQKITPPMSLSDSFESFKIVCEIGDHRSNGQIKISVSGKDRKEALSNAVACIEDLEKRLAGAFDEIMSI
jgi:hypothetical protein